MRKLPTYKELGRLLLFAAALILVLATGAYLYYMPRFNHSLINYVLFHPPDRKLDQPIEIGGILGKHNRIVVRDGAKLSEPAIVLDCIFFKAPNEKGAILYSQGVGSAINAMADHFKITTMLESGYSQWADD